MCPPVHDVQAVDERQPHLGTVGVMDQVMPDFAAGARMTMRRLKKMHSLTSLLDAQVVDATWKVAIQFGRTLQLNEPPQVKKCAAQRLFSMRQSRQIVVGVIQEPILVQRRRVMG